MAQSTGGEHYYCVEAPPARRSGKAASPEKMLNCFVRSVALVERAGNALGTLAFTWATVVLLGGYPTVLRPTDDFWFATTIVFLEAARMFSRNNRMDYQVFFNTRGAVRPLGWKGLVVVVILSNVLNYLFVISKKHVYASPRDEFLVRRNLTIGMLILAAALGRLLSPGAVKLVGNIPLISRSISLCSPLVAILLLVPSMQSCYGQDLVVKVSYPVFMVLFLAVLLLTISRLSFQRITKLVGCARGSKLVFRRRVIMNLCMLIALAMVVLMHDNLMYACIMLGYEIYAIVVVSFGNLQIPAAVLRVVLALKRLIPHNYYGDDNGGDNTNLAPSLDIFYGMVLGQGILYLLACMLDILSFIPRRSLARRGGFRGHWGVVSINLYHRYVLEKCMERDALAPKKTSLSNFAMDSLNSDSLKMQLHGIQLMQKLLQTEPTKTQLLEKLTTCAKTSARLINMLDWTNPRCATIRLLAAKVTAELAKGLRVVTIPGSIQNVSALLYYGNKLRKGGNPLMDTDGEQEGMHDPVLNASDNHKERCIAVPHSVNLLEIQDRLTQQVGTAEADQDQLPALGMSILYNLAGCDQSNCEEMIRATGLITKIIGFTNCCRTTLKWRSL